MLSFCTHRVRFSKDLEVVVLVELGFLIHLLLLYVSSKIILVSLDYVFTH